MPRQLSPQQFVAVSSLPAAERYSHFVKRVADTEEVWGLRGCEGWVGVGDDQGNEGIPFWPHPEYATACASGAWAGNEAASVDVHDFVDTWLVNMEAQGVGVAIFPTPGLKGYLVSASQLRADIQAELGRIE